MIPGLFLSNKWILLKVLEACQGQEETNIFKYLKAQSISSIA